MTGFEYSQSKLKVIEGVRVAGQRSQIPSRRKGFISHGDTQQPRQKESFVGRVRLRSQRYGWGTNVSSHGLAKPDVADRQLSRGKGATKTGYQQVNKGVKSEERNKDAAK